MDRLSGISLDWNKGLLEKEIFLTTGCSTLDKKLGGGIPCSGITQLYGSAGMGKTQLALGLSLTVQVPKNAGGLAAGAVYINTNAIFPSRRLEELKEKLEIAKRYNANGDKIFVKHISTMDALENCLQQQLPMLKKICEIGLIIIDSIAAPFRVEEWNDKSTEKTKCLRNIGQQLHYLSQNNTCVICINQVSAVIDDKITQSHQNEQPCLGATWSSMVTRSLHFYRRNTIRYISTETSYLPHTIIPFEIHGSGLKSL